ncbi:hypothetical protein QZM42_05570 [Burkholderia vietnamiensis]|uniref:hypothetical protein n=1 Tax=Burkholderia vietnamiensis TaxID=60552 RepID=UPI00264C6400|nr:hypothetical protein [Burkholderia vietnamiensis]MDN7408014.1 hypothetical protein [Burkholderia vietnamiensis]
MLAPHTNIGRATNSLYTVDKSSNPNDVLKAYQEGCAALRQLDNDEDFKRRLRDKAALKSKNQVTDEALKAARELAGSFKMPEITALTQVGVDEKYARDIMERAAKFSENISSNPDAKLIESDITGMKNAVCNASHETSSAIKAADRQTLILYAQLGIGGVSIMVADAVTELPSAGLSTLSLSLGAAMASAAMSKGFPAR